MTFQRAIIMLDNHELADESDAAWQALVSWAEQFYPEPPIAARGPVLVRAGDEQLIEVDDTLLRDMLARAARFGTSTQNNPFVPKLPPLDHVKVLLARDADVQDPPLPQVAYIADVPLVTADGTVVTDPGLHPSGVWYKPKPELADLSQYIQDIDDVDEIKRARDFLLDEWLKDFDFLDDASRANALGLVLLPFVREYIGNAPTPLYGIDAPQPGAGKTTLAETCLIPGLGWADVSVEPRDEEELRKKITSELIAGSRVVFFDNVSKKFASPTLAAALTSTQWKDRILGKSSVISLPNRLIWVATGNNLGSSSELRDRMCYIRLEPKKGIVARHRSADDFKHREIRRWTVEHRAEIVGACMTLVLHWLGGAATLRPDGSFTRHDYRLTGPTMGSYNTWAETIGGILKAADVSGFLENRDQLDVVDLDAQETTVFIKLLYDWSEGNEFTTRDLAPLCVFGGQFADYVPNAMGYLDKNAGHRIGRWLGTQRDATHDGLRLRMRQARGGLSTWRIEEV